MRESFKKRLNPIWLFTFEIESPEGFALKEKTFVGEVCFKIADKDGPPKNSKQIKRKALREAEKRWAGYNPKLVRVDSFVDGAQLVKVSKAFPIEAQFYDENRPRIVRFKSWMLQLEYKLRVWLLLVFFNASLSRAKSFASYMDKSRCTKLLGGRKYEVARTKLKLALDELPEFVICQTPHFKRQVAEAVKPTNFFNSGLMVGANEYEKEIK